MVLELVGAPRCVGCRSFGGALCCRCFDGIPPASVATSALRVLAGSPYEGAARSLILGLKVRGVRAYAAPLAGLCTRQIQRSGVIAEVVTWVPGRSAEIGRRGFDHAEEIGRGVAARTGLPAQALLFRRIETTDQTKLGRAERFTNLQGAFAARRTAFRVLLVDDLITTGATAAVCAEALVAAGAPSVEVIAACRA